MDDIDFILMEEENKNLKNENNKLKDMLGLAVDFIKNIQNSNNVCCSLNWIHMEKAEKMINNHKSDIIDVQVSALENRYIRDIFTTR